LKDLDVTADIFKFRRDVMSQIHLDHNAVTTLILYQVAEQKRRQEVLQQEAMV
jgi:hypothetical protein